MNKEQETIANIRSFIVDNDIKVGAQLPSERKFAEMLFTSRNTVRNAIRKLEARGLIEIRKGSGCYLLSKEDPFAAWRRIGSTESAENLFGLFEARYLLEPTIGSLAAIKNKKDDIDSLEKCLVRLSRHFISNDRRPVADGDAEFRKIIAASTGNVALVCLMDQFTAANIIVFKYLQQLNDESKDRLFADYVGMLNAVKTRDRSSITVIIEQNIRQQFDILRQFAQMGLPELKADLIRPATRLPSDSSQ